MGSAAPIIAAVTAIAGVYTAHEQGRQQKKAAKRASQQQERAIQQQEEAANKSLKQQEEALQQQEEAMLQQDESANRNTRKRASTHAALDAARQAGKAGASGTMLTGPKGVDPKKLSLGRQTLLGS